MVGPALICYYDLTNNVKTVILFIHWSCIPMITWRNYDWRLEAHEALRTNEYLLQVLKLPEISGV